MFKFYFKKRIKMILIWMAIIAVFCFSSFSKFDAFAADAEGTKQLMDSFPKVIMIVYGMNNIDITSVGGYFSVVVLFLTIMIAIYAGTLGSKIIYEEEDLMTSEFIFTRPVSRSKVYFTKFLVAFTTVTILNAFTLLISYVLLKQKYEVFDGFYINMLGQYIISLLGLSIGTFISSLKVNKMATLTSAGLITMLYIIKTFGEIKEINLGYITPFSAFNSYDVLNNNVSNTYIIYYIVISIVLVIAGNIFLNKRDLK